MSTSEEILARVTRAIDRRRRELDSDAWLRQVKVVVRKLSDGSWTAQVERLSEEPPERA